MRSQTILAVVRGIAAWLCAVALGCADAPRAEVDAGIRCAATGIADEGAITETIEPRGIRRCYDVPAVLVDGGAPALFTTGPDVLAPTLRDVGTLRCVGFAPGARARLALDLDVRVAAPALTRPENCHCGRWIVGVDAAVNGGAPMHLIEARLGEGHDSCRDGPTHRGVYEVQADARGEVRVALSLSRCEQDHEAARCLFVRGTRIALSPPTATTDASVGD